MVSLIRLVLNKERRGQVKPAEIATAIQSAERDLYAELLDLYRHKGVLSSRLLSFKASVTKTFTAGVVDVSVDDIEEITSAEFASAAGVYDAMVAQNDGQWTSRKLSDVLGPEGQEINSLSRYIQYVTSTDRFIELPSSFLRFEGGHVTVDGDDFPIQFVTPEQWVSRKVSDFIDDKERPDEPFWLNIEEDLLSAGLFTEDSSPLPAGVLKMLSFDNIIDGVRYEGIVASPAQLSSVGIKDLYEDDAIMKKHVVEVESTVSLVSGSAPLPEGFVKESGVFYVNGREGVILDSKAFMDRVNSTLLAPTEEKPIAKIHGGMIDVLPASIASITLVHYKFPNPKQPVGTIENGVFRVRPEPTEGIYIKTLKNPSARRPIVKIVDGVAEIKPYGINPVTIEFIAFPTEKAPIVRHYRVESTAGLDTVSRVYVRPDSLTQGELYFLRRLAVSVYAWVVYNRDYVFDEANSTDTMFGDDAVAELASKALIYMGVSKENASAAGLETMRDQAKQSAI
ncbi:MAG: hypothetical protein DRI46_06625 [Chloroflexi bacterium]|nr:MAG: hypothetical protein DRI46_06625 [Chloroflexota bacterium]